MALMHVTTTRVASLDHHKANRAMYQVVESSFKEWKSKFPVPLSSKLESIQDEILLIIGSVVWSKRLRNGYNLVHLSKWQSILHFVFSILAPYIQNRLLSASTHDTKWIHKVAAICRLANFLQLLHFYRWGGYQNLTERITGMKVEPRRTMGLLDFGAINRKLIWCTFRDLLILLISFRKYFWKLTRYKKNEEHADLTGILCTRCEQRVVIPVKSDTCGHICCYVCFHAEPYCGACGSATKNRDGVMKVRVRDNRCEFHLL